MKFVVIGAHLREEDVGEPAVALPAGELFLSAIPVDDDRPLGDRNLLLEVARVRGVLLERATFVAIRYGFAAAGASQAAEKCSGHLARWQRLLTENRDNVELTLKVAASSPQQRPRKEDFAGGADYLRALHQATRAATIDPAFQAAARQLLESRAVRSRWAPRDEKSSELALLVRRDRVEELRAGGDELRASFPSIPFLLSGPWPLEIFADADHE